MFKIPEAVYYLGWVIQPLLRGGYSVYGREDTLSNGGFFFKTLRECRGYIDEKISK